MSSWENIKSDQDFPVVEGTVLTLSCIGGEKVQGSETVTCVKDTEYTFSEEPKCCEFFVHNDTADCCCFVTCTVCYNAVLVALTY